MSHSKTMEQSAAAASQVGWIAETEVEREAIREQLALIIASPLFSHSKRFPNFLRYAVECALKGDANGHLKERTIGVEVFGRDPNYDTNLDPVVRMTAVEIRKRLAQYYKSPGRETEIRIDLPAGSYIPEFHPPAQIELPKAEATHRRPILWWLEGRAFRLPWVVAACMISCLLLAFPLARSWMNTSALDRFWGPVLASPSSVLLCIAGPPSHLQPNAPNTQPAANPSDGALTYGGFLRRNLTPFSDALALSAITGYLGSSGKKYRVRMTSDTVLDDLRDGPAVLIGAFNNAWTMRLLSQARFGFAKDGDSHYIRDRDNPNSRKWKLDSGMAAPLSSFQEDYALISRVLDPTTGHLVVTAAGIIAHGTRAAGEFLSEPSYMAQAEKMAPGDWKHKNIQVVISTKVIGDNAGPPHVLAAYLW